jgi:hypothetical protein
LREGNLDEPIFKLPENDEDRLVDWGSDVGFDASPVAQKGEIITVDD